MDRIAGRLGNQQIMTSITVPAAQLAALAAIAARGVPWSYHEADKAERLVREITAKSQYVGNGLREVVRVRDDDGASRVEVRPACVAAVAEGDESGW